MAITRHRLHIGIDPDNLSCKARPMCRPVLAASRMKVRLIPTVYALRNTVAQRGLDRAALQASTDHLAVLARSDARAPFLAADGDPGCYETV